jgi:uncharacterized repeat protein (TIGR03803 family)
MAELIECTGFAEARVHRSRTRAALLIVAAVAAFLAVSPAGAAGWTVTPLYKFGNAAPTRGENPRGDLAAASNGTLYGATERGGPTDVGTIFQLARDAKGIWRHTRLFAFAAAKGVLPQSGVVLGSDGALYGTTTLGGAKGGGTVYRLAKVSGVWTFAVLHHFDRPGGEGTGNRARLALDKAGNVYGTTTNSDGNYPGDGIVYQLKRPASGSVWAFKVLLRFRGGNSGMDPEGGVIIGPNGELYGLSGGSTSTPGTLYKLTPNAAGTVWTHQILHRFTNVVDGRYPNGTLARDSEGTLYGVAYSGGVIGPNFQYGGTVFSFTATGTFRVVYRFLNSKPNDGFSPMGGPILSSGALYGTTSRGGVNDDGIVYKLTKQRSGAWSESILHSFNGPTEGSALRGPLLQYKSLYYGTARNEGPAGGGAVFAIGP